MELDVNNYEAETQVGSYFVSNYPPFSTWTPDHIPAAKSAAWDSVWAWAQRKLASKEIAAQSAGGDEEAEGDNNTATPKT